ncbi:MAG: YkgJ family cysteine cluster protein [Armatimonadetes bacterium]|nr:YkgJ family cysteine cluster protein [Armatimonadota bacterium]
MRNRERPGWPYPREFVCHRCGNCCRGDGFVELSGEDIAAGAAALGIEESRFLAEYCRHDEGLGATILRDQGDPLKSCVFLDPDSSCRIHAGKPQQCRDFPFRWRPRDVLSYCDGMRALEGLPPSRRRTIKGE